MLTAPEDVRQFTGNHVSAAPNSTAPPPRRIRYEGKTETLLVYGAAQNLLMSQAIKRKAKPRRRGEAIGPLPHGPGPCRAVALDGPRTIGADLVLTDNRVSGRHCRLTPAPRATFVDD